MHIPPREFMHLWNDGEVAGNMFEDVACWGAELNFLDRIGGAAAVVVGHDHFNDFRGSYLGS
jgi:hypothetical protein